jgi:hypothetical protein
MLRSVPDAARVAEILAAALRAAQPARPVPEASAEPPAPARARPTAVAA